MKSILATIAKEWILLRRDLAGLMLLLLMPAVLIIVMALIQDAPFKDYQEIRFQLLLADEDGGKLSESVRKGLGESRNFEVISDVGGRPLSGEQLRALLLQGRYKVGIVVPRGANAEVVNAANSLANKVAEKIGAGRLPERPARDSLQLRVFFDPVTKPTFRAAISSGLDRLITAACSEILLQRMSSLAGESGTADSTAVRGQDDAEGFRKAFAGIGLREEILGGGLKIQNSSINSVQHNVPAWAIFGMFFIVVPIAGHAIREREEGSALRIQLIPGAQTGVALGKILFNALVCLVQFALMCCIGIWVVPLFGLPALVIGSQPGALLAVVSCIALAATAYGFCIGAIFRTTNQAMPFAAISIVIVSAMGGIWVPVDLLPPVMQKMALVSPLHWGLDGVQSIVLRGQGFEGIWVNMIVLLLFATLMWAVGLLQTQRRGHSIQ